MSCFADLDSELIVKIASLSCDSVDMFVQELEDLDPQDPNLEKRILEHPLMQSELSRQNKDIELLYTLDDELSVSVSKLKSSWFNTQTSNLGLTIMRKNIFKKWEPILELPKEIYLEGLHNDYEGFRLLLKGTGDQARTLRIAYDPVLAYRGIDEGDLIWSERFNDYVKSGMWSFFIVDSSDWLEWFHHTSQGTHKGENIIHYAIYTPNDCLDILSAYPPEVEWLN